ncbi:hypothetical protein BDN71DRAFT_1514257 [Pleurotus eryngii]|uniref:Uncharacterized protein n=1 Tax=Pleurotus eryngii TaxID=5323 RepID=A0A9P5ZFK0_PLEER|nr:hypothetical protein BDN71DRAFT_1514257 [Pleurotus eryngii]
MDTLSSALHARSHSTFTLAISMASHREQRLLDRAQQQEDIAAGRIQPGQCQQCQQCQPWPLLVLDSVSITPVESSATEGTATVISSNTGDSALDSTDSPLSSVPPSPSLWPEDNIMSTITSMVSSNNAEVVPEVDQGLVELLQAIMDHLESTPVVNEATPVMPAEAFDTTMEQVTAPSLVTNQCIETLVNDTGIFNAPQEFNVAGYLTVILPSNKVQEFLCPNLLSSADNVTLGQALQAVHLQQPAIFQELHSNVPAINLPLGTSYLPVPLVGSATVNSQYGFQSLGRLAEAFASSFVLPFASMHAPETSALYADNLNLMGSRLVVLHVYLQAVYMPSFSEQAPSLTTALATSSTSPLVNEHEGTGEQRGGRYLDSTYVLEKAYLEHFHTKVFGTAYIKIHTVRILDTIMDHLDMATHPRRDSYLPDDTSISEDSVFKWACVQTGTHQNSWTFTKRAYCLWKTLEAWSTSIALSSEQQGHLAFLKCLFTSHTIPASWKHQPGLGNLVKQAASLKKSRVDKMVEAWTREATVDDYGSIAWE